MKIDIFNHFMPKRVFERVRELVPHHPAMTAFPEVPTLWDVDERLRMMDEFDGLQQVLSLANPPLEQLGGPELTPQVARIANDGLAELVSRHPRRFPGFIASMPANNVEACLEEIDRSIDTLGARGIQLFTNVLGKPLSLPEFRPIFRRMAEHDLPVWIHPIRGPNSADYATEKASENEIWFTFGWPYETTACVTRLIFSGLYDELPGSSGAATALSSVSSTLAGLLPLGLGLLAGRYGITVAMWALLAGPAGLLLLLPRRA